MAGHVDNPVNNSPMTSSPPAYNGGNSGDCAGPSVETPGFVRGTTGLGAISTGLGENSDVVDRRVLAAGALTVGGSERLESWRSCSFRRIAADASRSIFPGSSSTKSMASILSCCFRTRSKRSFLCFSAKSASTSGESAASLDCSLAASFASAARFAISAAFAAVNKAISTGTMPRTREVVNSR